MHTLTVLNRQPFDQNKAIMNKTVELETKTRRNLRRINETIVKTNNNILQSNIVNNLITVVGVVNRRSQ